MANVNFELVTELSSLIRRDFAVASEALLNPYDSNPLLDGEWLELDANYKLARGTGEGTSATVFPLFVERGRYDVQAIKKATVIFAGMYEAETTVATLTGLAVGDALTVQMVTVGGVANKRGLAEAGATASRVVVGFVTKVLSDKVRFLHMSNHKVF